jgi:UDP-N-acetylmuramoyl-L-alanyl-D-glutamate--2,6-diaminopimelate ligase
LRRCAGRNGEAFLEPAIAAGAVAVLGENVEADSRVTVVKTPRARAALAQVAAAFYQQPAQRLKMLGVTGTNGKTTTTFPHQAHLREGAAALRAARHGAV